MTAATISGPLCGIFRGGGLLAAYRESEARVMVIADAKMTREERIRKFVTDAVGLFTKADIIGGKISSESSIFTSVPFYVADYMNDCS